MKKFILAISDINTPFIQIRRKVFNAALIFYFCNGSQASLIAIIILYIKFRMIYKHPAAAVDELCGMCLFMLTMQTLSTRTLCRNEVEPIKILTKMFFTQIIID